MLDSWNLLVEGMEERRRNANVVYDNTCSSVGQHIGADGSSVEDGCEVFHVSEYRLYRIEIVDGVPFGRPVAEKTLGELPFRLSANEVVAINGSAANSFRTLQTRWRSYRYGEESSRIRRRGSLTVLEMRKCYLRGCFSDADADFARFFVRGLVVRNSLSGEKINFLHHVENTDEGIRWVWMFINCPVQYVDDLFEPLSNILVWPMELLSLMVYDRRCVFQCEKPLQIPLKSIGRGMEDLRKYSCFSVDVLTSQLPEYIPGTPSDFPEFCLCECRDGCCLRCLVPRFNFGEWCRGCGHNLLCFSGRCGHACCISYIGQFASGGKVSECIAPRMLCPVPGCSPPLWHITSHDSVRDIC